MTANSVLAHLFRARPNMTQAAAALVDSEQPMRLAPTLTADDLPAGFEEILEVQVLGYRERLTSLHGGGRQRVLDPVWTLIPKVYARAASGAAHLALQYFAVRTMFCRSWFRRSVAGLPTVPRILMACFAVLLAAPGLSAADEETSWTVLTVARNGNWGIARARTRSEAIAGALDRCQAMTTDESDCGGELVAFRSGLALALMCGDHRVIVTANDSEEADSSALERLLALRGLYGPDFPACRHLLRIDSYGALTTFKARRVEGGYSLAAPK